MQHLFSVTTPLRLDRQGHQRRSAITVFLAEVDLGPSPQLAVPKTITGKLAPASSQRGLTLAQFYQFKFKRGVEVGFEGRDYRFSKMEKDGTFELSIIHQLQAPSP